MTEQNITAKINEYIKKFGEKRNFNFMPLDESGYTQVKRGSASIGINVLTEQNVLLFLSYIMEVPKENELKFYRKILELNFLETSDAAFAIDRKTNKVYLRALRVLTGLDYEEFEDMLDTIAKVADHWDDLLRVEFNKKPSEE